MLLENENPQINESVEKNNPLKEMLVNYVGEKSSSGDDDVTVGMIVETLANEFPEFLTVVAEENFIMGYRQALVDSETGQAAYQEYLDQQGEKTINEEQASTID